MLPVQQIDRQSGQHLKTYRKDIRSQLDNGATIETPHTNNISARVHYESFSIRALALVVQAS